MGLLCDPFIWSDNWWIDNDKAWFIDGIRNILFCLDLNAHLCEMAIGIPDENQITFRLTPICIKCGSDIFCMPGFGRSIWVYNLDEHQFTQVCIDELDNVQWTFDYWVFENKIYAIAKLTNKLLEINVTEKKLRYHTICEGDVIVSSAKVGNTIYCLSEQTERVYAYNLLTQKVAQHLIPYIGKKLSLMCFDGKKFWLSGYCKEIYVWDKETNLIMLIDDFPRDFGVYNFNADCKDVLNCAINEFENPTFYNSVEIGDYIWFIPYETNKIIYVNKHTHKLKVLEVDEDIETKESILASCQFSLTHKYLVEYVKDNRFLGLYSIKNACILEIDAIELKYQWHDYGFSEKCLMQCGKINQDVYYEQRILDREVYKFMVQENSRNEHDRCMSSIGTGIYEEMIKPVLE